ncbi:MAG: serine protease [Rhodovarius sp.]|nr:serine protease [Rhodovarius sp.]
MSGHLRLERRRAWAVLAAPLLGCAPLPAEQAAGTPAAAAARHSTATLLAHGATVGAAIALPTPGGTLLFTNAHVLRRAGSPLLARRADGGAEAPVRPLALSGQLDLALLEAPPGLFHPAAWEAAALPTGAPVWAVGPEGLGRSIARGEVTRPAVLMPGFGPGFTARLPVLMGFSGGPVLDAAGRVRGLTTALPEAGAAPLLALLTGVDVAGLAAGARREVFALSIGAAMAEAAALLG